MEKCAGLSTKKFHVRIIEDEWAALNFAQMQKTLKIAMKMHVFPNRELKRKMTDEMYKESLVVKIFTCLNFVSC